MKALILAAGKGERLRPLTREVPKPLIPILNKPVMEHVLELLLSHGIFEVFVNLHYQAEKIRWYFGDGSKWGAKIKYSYEPQILGTAGGLKKLEKYFNSTFLVISGDLLTDIDLTSLVKFHQKKKALVTLALSKVDDPSPYGVALLDEDFKIVGFQEKPKKEEAQSNLVNCGIYVMEPEVFPLIPPGKFYDFGKDLFPRLVQGGGEIYGFIHKNYWRDVGNIDSYREGNFDALEGKIKLRVPGEEVKKSVWVGKGSKIHPSVKIYPPVCIGENCLIEEGSEIVGPSVIGDDCYIKSNTRLEKVVKWRDGFFASGAKVKEGLIGESVAVIDGKNSLESAIVDSGCFIYKGKAIPKEEIRFELGGICFSLRTSSEIEIFRNYFDGFLTDQTPEFSLDVDIVPTSSSNGEGVSAYFVQNPFLPDVTVYVENGKREKLNKVFNVLMHFLYQHAAIYLGKKSCLLHSAGVGIEGKALLFVGPPGIGKSTVSRLIRENEPKAEILSDEICIVNKERDGLFVYSTPFRGDYPGKRSVCFSLKGVYFLQQSEVVRLDIYQSGEAVLSLIKTMPPFIKIQGLSCFDLTHKLDMAMEIARKASIYKLSFRPDFSFWPYIQGWHKESLKEGACGV